ncbi:hypothetical protein TIFTF001_024664 [Ficus carica]|uniref:Uncharacterized protein n=1 Tax=Ficus carica TaxID=3494 RepID=A0AA88AH79_FICCA|nr:hypothetical protein TIFTF001_024664 [Ficus carica]
MLVYRNSYLIAFLMLLRWIQPTFQRNPRPDKEYQSFSILYKEKSLDLICKDKDEAEVWFTGLKAIILRFHREKGRTELRNDVAPSESSSPRACSQKSSPLTSSFGTADNSQKDGVDAISLNDTRDNPPKLDLEKALSGAINTMPQKATGSSDVVAGRLKDASVDAFRVSSSSAVSSSSQGSGNDGGDALGDVFIWGEGIGDGILGGGVHKTGSCSGLKMDSHVPKALESAVVLDVQSIACGAQHAVLVTKQGDVFSWGEELGGRLGHGVDCDVSHPKLIDGLKNINIEFVACGEYHSCAVTLSGEMYTWGGISFKSQLNGHGNEARQWVPKKLNGILEGIHVSLVSCGPWHTAIVTSAGQLYTFGDGTFGALGHGDQTSVAMPREVESLKGLRTVRAACGVWHTAAVVEVMVGLSCSSSRSSGKLYTWGDGDKGRLGHGDKETRLIPTCVAALVESSFCQVACGHSLTVALTTTGNVYTMGSPVCGQLGDPKADGKIPICVEGKLTKNFVEEIACGAYHVAVLTSRTEVYTWGKGANGRLGHGNTEDRTSPTLVEDLKDKQVKTIICGANFTAAICLHKWHSDFDHSTCSGCRLPFNFKRKRHNCYNCGLVLCHSCSSKKSSKASMAPNPEKPYRVCDNCFEKLRKAAQTNPSSHYTVSRRGSVNQEVNELIEKNKSLDSRSHMKEDDIASFKRNKKLSFNSNRVLPISNQVSDFCTIDGSKSFNPVFGSSKKFFSASLPGSRIVSRATSPTSRRSSPPRAKTPVQTLSGLTLSKVVNETKRTNESLSKEVIKLRAQVEDLTSKSQLREIELEKATRQLKEAIAIAAEETAKCKAAKEVIKSLTAQLKDMAERLPTRTERSSNTPSLCSASPTQDVPAAVTDQRNSPVACRELHSIQTNSLMICNVSSIATNTSNTLTDNEVLQPEVASKIKGRAVKSETTNGDEWVEQDEAGVYFTLASLPGGLKYLKRVRFRTANLCVRDRTIVSRKRFSEKQAEQWWAANRSRVYQRFNVHVVDKSSVG